MFESELGFEEKHFGTECLLIKPFSFDQMFNLLVIFFSSMYLKSKNRTGLLQKTYK